MSSSQSNSHFEYLDNSAHDLMTSSITSDKSISTIESKDFSKRSTTEDELRSLSTTPRYSHEDLGRIVSPPHLSDTETPAGDFIPDEDITKQLDAFSVEEISKAHAVDRTANTGFKQLPTIPSKTPGSSQVTQQLKPKYIFQEVSPGSENNYRSAFSDKGSFKTTPLTSHVYQEENFRSHFSDKSSYITSVSDQRPDFHRIRAAELLSMRMSSVDENLREVMMDAESVRRNLSSEQGHRQMLERQQHDIEEETKELNAKLANLRVKLGVANSNFNVSKNECDQMRKKFQETEIQKARLEERIKNCNKELDRLKDPNNPDSNVNLKKIVLNDRKEIRRLKTVLEGVKSERSDIQKQIQDQDEKIRALINQIAEAREQLDEVKKEYETAKISVVGERKKKEEVEAKYNELLKEKVEFDDKMSQIQSELDEAALGSTGMQKQYEDYKEREHDIISKMNVVEKKLKEVLTEIEQQKNRNMPQRTASSIKYHQYRMTNTSLVSDTTPHVIVATNPNASIAASGYLGKTVVSKKPVSSLQGSKRDTRQTTRSKGGSLPAKR